MLPGDLSKGKKKYRGRRWSKEIKREDGLFKMKLGHDGFCITVR